MLFIKEKDERSARAVDREREADLKKGQRKKTPKARRQIKRTTIQTMPYESFVSNYVMLNRSNVKVGKETCNLYSKTYLVPDVNYMSLTKDQQDELMQQYVGLLNGYDNSATLQVTLVNTKINQDEFEAKMLLKEQHDGLDRERQEFNQILRNKITETKKGIHCRIYFTVTVPAVSLDAANNKFFAIEVHLLSCMNGIGTSLIALTANERVRLMADILCDVNTPIRPATMQEFARQSEKMLCCPDYFEFKKDYFLYNNTYARCLYVKRIDCDRLTDNLFSSLVELNLSLIITHNIEFVEPAEAQRSCSASSPT